ncbi:MAG: glycosyltransferase family 1 protein [Patescibacteria group bacterium]
MLSDKSKTQSRKLKVGIFADDMDRRGMGTALLLRRLVAGCLDEFPRDIDLRLIHREGFCRHPLCERAERTVVKMLPLPKFAGFFSYLRFFIFTGERFDVIHFPRPSLHPLFWLLKILGKTKKIVVTFHGAPENDDIPVYQTPMTRFNRRFIALFAKRFIDAAIVDADVGIGQVAGYYRFPKNGIRRIYAGVDQNFRPLAEEEKPAAERKIAEKYGIKKPYLLTVARLDPHKNVHRLVESLALIRRNNLSLSLVIVGGKHEPEYSKLVEETVLRHNLGNSVHFAPFVEEEDLPAVYSLAEAFIFISLSEGFGLPMLEAMGAGTPVIASGLSVMPEIAGDAALFIDPYDVNAIAAGIEKLLADDRLKKELIERGRRRARQFSWNNFVAAHIALYKEISGR